MSDFTIIRSLNPNGACLAQDSAGRDVVLKAIDADCLLNGQLHPHIADRLQRVRELAHLGVANLLSVDYHDGKIVQVWQYLPGQTLADYMQTMQSRDDFAPIRREIEISVQSLHALGIVHGRLHERNIIIDKRGRIFLTHISPLLHYDQTADDTALAAMFTRISKSKSWNEPEISTPRAANRTWRARPLLGAAGVLLAAILLASAIIWLTEGTLTGHSSPPRAPIEAMSP